MVNIGINGLGRIGRCVIRAWLESGREDVNITAVNFRRNTQEKAHLLKYDSSHGVFKDKVTFDDNHIHMGNTSIHVFHNDDPANIPWREADVDIVLECTGVFKSHADASAHLKGGAKKVLISAPSPDPDAMVVYGVNNDVVQPEHQIISVGSCTTNCLAPIVKVLDETVGIESGFMTTIHAYTSDQNLLDNNHKDLRRARAAALSMIPTSTGAAKAIGKVMPHLNGKLDGVAVRVPTPNVSFVDLTFNAKQAASEEAIHAAMQQAADGELKDVLEVCEAPLVSIDFNGNPHSSIFDATQTKMLGDKLVRVAGWYDNEWGFSNRMLDVAKLAGDL